MPAKAVALATGLVLCGVNLAAPPKYRETAGTLPRIEFVRTAAAGLLSLAADVFWLESIQLEGRANTAEGYRAVSEWGNFATDLDPDYLAVYHFVPVATTFNLGRERWVNTAESTALLRKGLKRFPDDWTLNFQLAHNLMYYDHNYREAGEIIQRLGQRSGRSALALLATRLFAQGDDFGKARALAVDLAQSAPSEELREYYQRRVLQVDQEELLKQIDQAVLRFRTRFERLPSNLEELVAQGELPGMPRDPLGGTISIDAEGRARASSEWYRLEIYDDKKKKKTAAAQGDLTTFVPH